MSRTKDVVEAAREVSSRGALPVLAFSDASYADVLLNWLIFADAAGALSDVVVVVADCSTYVLDQDGDPLVTSVGRFDQRNSDLDSIRMRLPGQPSLGEVHTQGGSGAQTQWTDRAIELVAQVYARDIAKFDFEVPTPLLDR